MFVLQLLDFSTSHECNKNSCLFFPPENQLHERGKLLDFGSVIFNVFVIIFVNNKVFGGNFFFSLT